MGDANGIPGLELWPESAPAIVSIWGMILQVKELSFPPSSTGNSDFQINTFKKKMGFVEDSAASPPDCVVVT